MGNIITYFRAHKYKCLLIPPILFFFPLVIVHCLYKWHTGLSLLEAEWTSGDLLGYYASFLAFFSTTLLGIVALLQNRQLQNINDSMQRLEQAQFISMIHLEKIHINYMPLQNINYISPVFSNPEVINTISEDFTCTHCYCIDIQLKNESLYPIVQLVLHSGGDNAVHLLYGIKNCDTALYIPSKGITNIRIIIPSKMFELRNTYSITLKMFFINIFDYHIKSSLVIPDLTSSNPINFKYRLAKFTDIKPKEFE
ncbi:MAG: hypothetical protein KHX84_15125 [Enterocloster asparagiformis]|nr:hypothetical protein [Enterocloster asparagiformis]